MLSDSWCLRLLRHYTDLSSVWLIARVSWHTAGNIKGFKSACSLGKYYNISGKSYICTFSSVEEMLAWYIFLSNGFISVISIFPTWQSSTGSQARFSPGLQKVAWNAVRTSENSCQAAHHSLTPNVQEISNRCLGVLRTL